MQKEWQRLLESNNTSESLQFQSIHSEIKGELQQLDYDLHEVARSIVFVEEHRDRFNQLNDGQLSSRREFVRSSRSALKELRDVINTPQFVAKIEDDKREALLGKKHRDDVERERRLVVENQGFLADHRLQQTRLIKEQDDGLTELSKNAQRLGNAATAINNELQYQQRQLDDLNEDVGREADRMNFIMKGVGKLLKTSNPWQIGTILSCVGLFFLLLFIAINI